MKKCFTWDNKTAGREILVINSKKVHTVVMNIFYFLLWIYIITKNFSRSFQCTILPLNLSLL